MTPFLLLRNGIYYARVCVPLQFQKFLDGKVQLWKSLKTDDQTKARLLATAWVGSIASVFTVDYMTDDQRRKRIEANLERSMLNLTIALGQPITGPLTYRDEESPVAASAQERKSKPQGISIAAAFKDYMREHTHRRAKSVQTITAAFKRFLVIAKLTDRSPVQAITKPLCVAFKTALVSDGLAFATINMNLTFLNHFLKWSKVNGHYAGDIPTEGLKLPARAQAAGKLVKVGFSPTEMKALFTHDYFTRHRVEPGGRLGKRGHVEEVRRRQAVGYQRYWALLLLAYTGARASEIFQLLKSDIRTEEGTGIQYVNIEEDAAKGKFLKNRISNRKLPIHSALLKMVFMEFVAKVNTEKLFPSLDNKDSTAVTQYFNRLMVKCGIVDKAKTMHSLRHTMTVSLEKAKVHPSIRHKILGHAVGERDVEGRVYLGSLAYSLTELREEGLEKVVVIPSN